MFEAAQFDAALLRQHNRPGPRYTSYPSALQFRSDFGVERLRQHALRSDSRGRRLSLYVHVPFCFSPCFYCGCTRVIARDARKGEVYVDRLLREIELTIGLFAADREVVQLHLGGGTPNFLSAETLARLVRGVGRRFRLSTAADRDFSIELDPRTVPPGYALALVGLGFNRVSLGVQDFDPEVQRAVNRQQSVAQTLDVIDECRDSGIRSINVDLMYGLPHQTLGTFQHTLRIVTSARPERVAVYGYAHLPTRFRAQRHIAVDALPGPEERMELLRLAIDELCANGYRYVGMDHFALPEDELVQAQERHELQRNFMGYTTHADTDLLGFGVSAISHIGDSFSQNVPELKAWEAAIDAGALPLARGLELSADDRVRSAVIGQLMCEGRIEVRTIERDFGIDFWNYFRDALEQLQPHIADGLVRIEGDRINVSESGQLLLRSIAMCFDAYLSQPHEASQLSYSKVV